MKNFILTLFSASLISFSSFCVQAKVVEMNQVDISGQSTRPANSPAETLPNNMPDPNNLKEVAHFFRERFKNAEVTHVGSLEEFQKADSMNVQHSTDYIQQMQTDNKSVFEKIYDQAMGRISDNGAVQEPSETIFYQEVEDRVQNEIGDMNAPDVPVVDVVLPSGRKILAPAREHIPYMLASYNILPTGLIQAQEEITVVANGRKLKNGFVKMIRKNSVSRANVRKKLDIDLLSVTINGQEVPHRLEEIGDYIYIKPQKPYILPSGVYTYTFNYLMDRKLWYYDDFSEFYVDVTGSYLNLLITSANAIVSVPDGRTFLSQNVIIGSGKNYNPRRAMIASLDKNALGFASVTPLLPGEGMHLLVALDKSVFLQPDLNQRFVWFVTDYGDILFAFAGLGAILISYLLSWGYLKKQKKGRQNGGAKRASLLRYMLLKKFDKRSFVSSLLELYSKNVIDIEETSADLALVKKTDNVGGLSVSEKKALSALFGKNETVLPVSSRYRLKFSRAEKILQKGVIFQSKMFRFKINIGYLFFSIAMLILAEVSMAMLSVNPLQTSFILFSATLTFGFYIWMFRRSFKNKFVRWGVRGMAFLFITLAVLFAGIYIHLISALMLVGMVFVIFEFSSLFAKQSGLSKAQTAEIDELKKYLTANATTIGKSRNFSVRQADIFALELESFYPKNEYNMPFYKLDLADKMLHLL